MADPDYTSYLRLLRDFWGEFRSVQRRQTPGRIPRLLMHTQRAALVALCHYPNKKMSSKPVYRRINWILLFNQTLMFISMVCGVHESSSIIDMGDDFVWLIGLGLICTKSYCMHARATEIDEVIRDLAYYDEVVRPIHDDEEILKWQRYCYMGEAYFGIGIFSLVNAFSLAILLQPLLGEGRLPYHSFLPFGWHRQALHPWTYRIAFGWLSVNSLHNLSTILFVDLLGISTILQTALNLKLLSIELRRLGDLGSVSDNQFHVEFCRVVRYHQHIISLVDKSNRAFYITFIAQMIASFAMISISTFETMVAAADDPKMAAKFVLFVMVGFVQLSAWCVAGNLVLSLSGEVGQAAFEISDWHTKSASIQRDIAFIMLRAQKPLFYVARPFMPLSLGSYMIVLKQCYRLLALLRESM
ncbi:odorant receptor 47b [Drosophila miranda]|uniref:odorant receptor 47b n=1 Tax=Drosophila miranda TaxID=7229 RepID=UPI0007E7FB28|nr:odorant receptor 47b [Drosophila miranda]